MKLAWEINASQNKLCCTYTQHQLRGSWQQATISVQQNNNDTSKSTTNRMSWPQQFEDKGLQGLLIPSEQTVKINWIKNPKSYDSTGMWHICSICTAHKNDRISKWEVNRTEKNSNKSCCCLEKHTPNVSIKRSKILQLQSISTLKQPWAIISILHFLWPTRIIQTTVRRWFSQVSLIFTIGRSNIKREI